MAQRNHSNDHPFDDPDRLRSNPRSRVRKRRRWPWALILLLTIVFFLPNVIAMTSLKQQVIDYAFSDFNGSVTIESASLGWLQPVLLKNVQAVDKLGQPLATFEEVKTSRSLISFLASSDYGIVKISHPAVWLQLRPDGSNIEDACAAWLIPNTGTDSIAIETTPESKNLRLPKIQLDVHEGTIAIFSVGETKSWQIEQLNVEAYTSHELAAMVANTACQVTVYDAPMGQPPVAKTSGKVMASIQIDPDSSALTGKSITAALQSNSMPLSVAGPLLQRFLGPTQTDGSLTTELQTTYNADSGQLEIVIKQANAENLSLVSPQQIGTDEFHVTSAAASGKLTVDPSSITAKQLELVSDFASLSANGILDLNQLLNLTSEGSSTDNPSLLNTPFQLAGEIDLAGIATSFPATFRLHEGLQIDSGGLNFQAASRVENGVRRLIVNVDTANLVARDHGRPIVWQKPLRFVGAIRESTSGLVLEELLCESDFLTVTGTATNESGSFATTGDLKQLTNRIGQFVDLGNAELAGRIDGKLAWQTTGKQTPTSTGEPGNSIQVVGEFNVDRPRIELLGMPRWQRPQLTARISAAGKTVANYTVRLDQGGMQVDIGNEQAVITLAEPIADAFSNTAWKFNAQVSGSAAGWLAHIKNFADLGSIQTDGQIQARSIVHVTNKVIELHEFEYELNQFRFEGYGLNIREHQTNGTANARYDLVTGQLQVANAALSSNSISLGGQQILIDTAKPVQINGDVAFLADVNRVADWLSLSPNRDSVFWFGTGEGTIRFSSDSNGIGAQISTEVKDMIAATREPKLEQNRRVASAARGVQSVSNSTPWTELWREAQVNLNGTVVMSSDFETIAFENTSLESTALRANMSGQISDLSGAMLADIKGNWSPDWQKLNTLLTAYTSQLVQMSGQGNHPISIHGPLFEPGATNDLTHQPNSWVSPLLAAATSLGWQQARFAGLPVGAGQLKFDLQNGIANAQTSSISFSQGTIQLQTQTDLRGTDPVLYLPQGKIVEQVALTPETARNWLKFVAPLAADATSVQGTFSLSTKGAQVPLTNPMKMRAEGELTLSNVVIGAGPTSKRLISMAQQLQTMLDPTAAQKARDSKTWLTLEEQTIPVAVQDGRVFHDGIKISHKDILIQTRGSVGLDQSLDLVAEIPIVDNWIEGKKHLSALRGQKISIPVTGTASKPKLDLSAINQISGQLLQQTAAGEISKLLDSKVAPKVTEYQNEINDRVGKEVNRLQDKLFDKLAPRNENQPASSPEGRLKDELIKGFGNLFGR